MALNPLLLRAVLAQIETSPETWHQDHWRCKTAMCVAGWTCELTGGRWVTDAGKPFAYYLLAEPGDAPGSVHNLPMGDGVLVDVRARRLLGLTQEQADELFLGANRLDDIRRIVTDLIAQTYHVTIRIVPCDELVIGETLADGRAPLEIVEHRPGQPTITHGTERGIPHGLADHARAVAEHLGVPYIDPIDPAAMERLTKAEVA